MYYKLRLSHIVIFMVGIFVKFQYSPFVAGIWKFEVQTLSKCHFNNNSSILNCQNSQFGKKMFTIKHKWNNVLYSNYFEKETILRYYSCTNVD